MQRQSGLAGKPRRTKTSRSPADEVVFPIVHDPRRLEAWRCGSWPSSASRPGGGGGGFAYWQTGARWICRPVCCVLKPRVLRVLPACYAGRTRRTLYSSALCRVLRTGSHLSVLLSSSRLMQREEPGPPAHFLTLSSSRLATAIRACGNCK